MPRRRASTKGFTRTDSLLAGQIRRASEERGFAQSRLLTQWAEIAGAEIARIARPVQISYGQGGFGATLTLLTKGANGPMLQMQLQDLRERVNAVYGYNAIARIKITQTASTGFSEGQVAFETADPPSSPVAPDPSVKKKAAEAAEPVTDAGLKAALARLGENILSKEMTRQGANKSE